MTDAHKAAETIALAVIDEYGPNLPSALAEISTATGREITMTFTAKPLMEDVDVVLSMSPKVVIEGETVDG